MASSQTRVEEDVQAARAAFVFKGGHNRQDYEKALPYLVSFY
jgi:hypothetical protein